MVIDTLDNAGSSIEPHDPEQSTPSRVHVNGVRVPVGDVDVMARKEGPLSFTRYAEGEIVSEWNGEDYASLFDTLQPSEQTSTDTLRIDVRDRVTGDYHVAFHGFITGVGNAPESGSSWWSFRAQGPGHLLDNIPASKSFSDASARDILQYINGKLKDELPVDITVGETPSEEQQVGDGRDVGGTIKFTLPPLGFGPSDSENIDINALPPLGGFRTGQHTIKIDTPFPLGFGPKDPHPTTQTFNYGKSTLTDVISWLEEKTNLYLWFTPTPGGVTLSGTNNPPTQTHRAHYLDGDTRVVNNDALSELKPVNTLVLKAPAKESVKPMNTFQINERGGTLVAVKARHKGLYRRAGEHELHAETTRLSDALTKAEAEREARKRLKSKIDETTAGSMQTLLRSPVTPYDTVEALPTCDETAAVSMDPLTFEIARVHHKITAEGFPETDLNVGISTNPQEDIEIIDSWEGS